MDSDGIRRYIKNGFLSYKTERMHSMTFASYFHTQGQFAFAKLFQQIFPQGADLSKISRFIDYKRAVEAQLYTFQLNERYQIVCACSHCKEELFIPVWDLAVALEKQSFIPCNCDSGSLLPMHKVAYQNISA